MKPYPWKCGQCRERAVYRVTVPYSVDLEHDGRTYAISVADLTLHRCRKCGAMSLDDEANRRITEALRHAVGLLPPEEIRQHREHLGLTQKELARHLEIAESTLSRWETGAQIQQRCLDRLLRLFFELPEVRKHLGVGEPVA
jgi:putative zinc finger/helix-turn-helix YgiT family protein